MAIENWIDEIPKLWEQIQTHEGGTLKAYRLFDKAEFPETIAAPAVLTYPTEMSMIYSTGGPIFEHWYGRSDFYLFDNVSKVNLPALISYMRKARNAAIGSITLSSTVVNFSIGSVDLGRPTIEGPLEMTYGNAESPYHGFIINWFVKSDISNENGVTVAA